MSFMRCHADGYYTLIVSLSTVCRVKPALEVKEGWLQNAGGDQNGHRRRQPDWRWDDVKRAKYLLSPRRSKKMAAVT